tara:strand:- start:2957 stop:3541 length:585 start_codon:yes stop_codon:yes gene_type:complete
MIPIIEKIGSIHNTTIVDGLSVLKSVYKTCKEMISDRGYTDIEETHDLENALEECLPVLRGYKISECIDIYFYNEERVGVKFIRNILESSTELNKIIIVSLDGPTAFTRKESEKNNIEFFLFKNLCVNITRHDIVPKHELALEVPWTEKELPKIYTNDFIVQYYNFPVNSIVKISRTFGCHEPSVFYRIVCESI